MVVRSRRSFANLKHENTDHSKTTRDNAGQADIESAYSTLVPTTGWFARYAKLVVVLTIIATVIGAIQGGISYAAVFAVIVLVECASMIIHDRTIVSSRQSNDTEPKSPLQSAR